MRVFERHAFGSIQGFKLGWSPLGPPLMTVFCYRLGDLLIDTGLAHVCKEILEIAARHGIRRVFLTHHHEDHSGNAALIRHACHARVFGHPLTTEKMATASPILPYQKYIWGKSTPLSIEPFPQNIETPLGAMIPIHTPGHSKDHTAFLLKDAGALFAGDLYLADTIKYFRSDENVVAQIESLRKILKLDFDILLCGHYPKLKKGKTRIAKKLAFLETLCGDIIRLWDKGYSEKEIFRALQLKEHYLAKILCFGNVSMLNGVKSVIRHSTALK